MMLGIDFTGSNGSPANPDSLHYRSPVPNGSANQYEQAIMSLGEVRTSLHVGAVAAAGPEE